MLTELTPGTFSLLLCAAYIYLGKHDEFLVVFNSNEVLSGAD